MYQTKKKDNHGNTIIQLRYPFIAKIQNPQDTMWESLKKKQEHITQVSVFLAGDHKAAMNR